MNETIARLLNEQINKEFYSAYLYLDMANYYDSLDLDGYANYYMIPLLLGLDHVVVGIAVQIQFIIMVGNIQIQVGTVEFLVDLIIQKCCDGSIHKNSPFRKTAGPRSGDRR